MLKPAFCAFMAPALVFLAAAPAKAQIVTSYYAPPVVAPSTSIAYTPGAVLTPAVATPVVGTIPVRRGLFGLRTEHVPVLGAAPVVAPVASVTAVAQPAVTAYSLPYAAARPVIATTPLVASTPLYTSGTALSAMNPVLPNALIQSGYRGATPIVPINTAPVLVSPAPSYPFNAGPYQSFYPGAVMTMQ